ncbi:hypothetical protein Tco_1492899 [Tanacetum coccineum]
MLLAMKDEARGNLNEEENDFMLDNAYGDDTLEELRAVVIMMAHIQPADDKAMLSQSMMLRHQTRSKLLEFSRFIRRTTIPSKEDLNNLFGPLYEELLYATRTPEVLVNFASSSSIIIEDHNAPQIVSSLEEPIVNEPTTLVFDDILMKHVQK